MKIRHIHPATAVLALSLPLAALAADYPTNRIEMVIPFDAGGGVDATGRLIAAEFERQMGQKVIVLNVSGAGGAIGAAKVAKAGADGYTIGMLPVGTATTQPHMRPVAYDNTSWEPICLAVKSPMAVLVKPDGPFNTMDKLIAGAKSGRVKSAGPPPGSMPHIAQAALAQLYGVKFAYVPFEGGNGATTAVLGGQVDFTTEPYGSGARLGLKPLVILAPQRVEALPDVPSIKEVTGKDIDYSTWFGLFAPKGTPAAVVKKLSDACGTATRAESFKAGIANLQWDVKYLPSDKFTAFFQEQYKSNGELFKELGLGKK